MFPSLRVSLALFLGCLAAFSAQGALVRGTVSSTTGARLSGKVVAAYDAAGLLRGTATTDAAGMYILTLPNGGYRVLAYDPAGAYATTFHAGADSFETTPFVQAVDGAPVQADFALPPGGTVSGLVMAGSAPVAGATVEAYNLSGSRRGFTTVNAAGQYSLVLPAGDFKLFAYDANGVYAGEFHANVRAFADAAPVRVTPPGSTTVHFVLERAARVTGTVLDADMHTGLASMLVYAYTAAGSLVTVTTTDANGAFRFDLGPGQYRFVAGDPSRTYGPAFYGGGRSFERAQTVTLIQGQQLSAVNVHAERGAEIRGRVPPGLTVVAYNLDGTVHATTTANAAGDYVLVVAPGEYKLAAIDPAGGYAVRFLPDTGDFRVAREVAIFASQTLTGIDFHPPRAGRFSGTVRDAVSTQPLAGMIIAAYDAAGALIAQTTSAANGTYTLAVAPGQYRLLVTDSRLEYATAYAGGATSFDTTVPVSVAADATSPIDFAMRRGVRVNGIVRDENDAPVKGVEIFALDLEGNRVAGATAKDGAFSMVLLPGTYRFAAFDPRSRYVTEQYSGGAQVIVGSQTPLIAFTLNPVTRRRLVRH